MNYARQPFVDADERLEHIVAAEALEQNTHSQQRVVTNEAELRLLRSRSVGLKKIAAAVGAGSSVLGSPSPCSRSGSSRATPVTAAAPEILPDDGDFGSVTVPAVSGLPARSADWWIKIGGQFREFLQ